MLKISVDHIKDTPFLLHFSEPLAAFPLLMDVCTENSCQITGIIEGDLTITREYETIRVVGRVTAPLTLACSRCLIDFESFIDSSFTLFFRKEAVSSASSSEEIELAEIDLLSSVYSGDEIDLTHEIEEQIVMEIPVKPLCQDECKGLCHQCGADLNISGCACVAAPVTLGFSALKDFKVLTN